MSVGDSSCRREYASDVKQECWLKEDTCVLCIMALHQGMRVYEQTRAPTCLQRYARGEHSRCIHMRLYLDLACLETQFKR